ncbi:MAG: hypothetical protein H9855_12205 [Candidatus Acinetobacter avistercoris]|uniref:hypothetical protein n=1 Tax=Acinetobacter sp. KS-LM10 TaxID=3120518 RepID=UPI001FA4FD97|nr:hypothetical protein [Candidatus Acinetobacter avistercoris]
MIKKSLQISSILLSCVLLNACATRTLIEKDKGSRTTTHQINLINDTVIAFGKPAYAVNNLPNDSIVIIGERHSYVLTQGGTRFTTIISSLDPKNIEITRSLAFLSEKNDGHFSGLLPITYTKLSEDVTKADRQFFIQNSARECTSSSDQRLKAQRFCFDIKLEGVVYPQARNTQSLTALSKPYEVRIYTNQYSKEYSKNSSTAAQKLVLLPFAVGFDVVTLPFQAIAKIFD